MSKQSNQRYRKELEKKQLTSPTNSAKNQEERYDYGDGDFEAPSNNVKQNKES